MRYKITKYKGKTKIKDLKSGTSSEIDIEHYMNGGYKSTPKYMLGAEHTSNSENNFNPPIDWATEDTQMALIEEEDLAQENLNYLNSTEYKNIQKEGDKLVETPDIINTHRGNNNYQMFNPYAGADIPSSAYMLGQSIQNKDGLGIAGAGLKLATGLGRNFVSGLGGQNRYNQVLEDAHEKEKNNRNPVQFVGAYGGVFDPIEKNGIKEDIVDTPVDDILENPFPKDSVKGRALAKFSNIGKTRRPLRQEVEALNKIIGDDPRYQNKIESFAYGGKKEEELATGEYVRGVENEDQNKYNAEVEQGEYLQTNQGDIAEVVGNKHSKGGEKMQLEENDRILSDKLKLGAKTAKELSKKYGLKLKYKNTYSDVLDKLRKKLKLNKIVDEEAILMKKIADQDLVEDDTTKELNLQALLEKKEELAERKHPLEEQRKEVFSELFEMQESTKKGSKKGDKYMNGGTVPRNPDDLINSFKSKSEFLNYQNPYPLKSKRWRRFDQKQKNLKGSSFKLEAKNKYPNNTPAMSAEDVATKFTYTNENRNNPEIGVTQLEDLENDYFVPKATNLVPSFSEGGPGDRATKVNRSVAEQKVKNGDWEQVGQGRYLDRGTGEIIHTGISYKNAYKKADKNKYPTYEEFEKEAIRYNNSRLQMTPDKHYYAEMPPVEGLNLKHRGEIPTPNVTLSQRDFRLQPRQRDTYIPERREEVVNENPTANNSNNGAGMFLFPDESPLAPSSLQGTLKPEARFDRVRSTEIDARPYLQDIRDREDSQIQNLEGLSPNVRAAVLSNLRANSQKSSSDIRNRIDTQNLQSQEKAIYTNANIQRQEQNQNNNYRQSYENRIYTAQAKTDHDINNYLNSYQKLNATRFEDIHNMNLINASNEDLAYVPGRGYVRKQGSSDKDLYNKAFNQYIE